MKPPLSHHLAVAIAELCRRFPNLALIDLFLVAAFSVAAALTDAKWLFVLAALALGEAAVLYLGRGLVGVLDADRDELASLQNRYRWMQ